VENASADGARKYLLSKHAYLCIDAGCAILLDLREDKYIGLDAVRARRISSVVQGWPTELHDAGDGPIGQNLSPDVLIQPLIDRGLITTDFGSGKDATPVKLEDPHDEVGADEWRGDRSISLGDLLQFVTSVLFAFLQLHLRPIEKTVQRVHSLRQRRPQCEKPNKESLARSVAAFVRLRPLLFTSRDHCLFECLALITFLARKQIYPTWVFAVHSSPFGAHCWLQVDSVVLNDTLENVQNFTPIMKV
jgi:hypothetical protein